MAILEHRVGTREDDVVVAALSRPEAYAGSPAAVEVRQTPISHVFPVGDRAYKLKKPLRLPFVDYSTAARRRSMCEEEIRLNRRLAPNVYLDVRSTVTGENGTLTLGQAEDPRAVDHVVEMRRFDERRTLAALVTRGGFPRATLESVGKRLAAFYAGAATAGADGATAALHAAVAEKHRHAPGAGAGSRRQLPCERPGTVLRGVRHGLPRRTRGSRVHRAGA